MNNRCIFIDKRDVRLSLTVRPEPVEACHEFIEWSERQAAHWHYTTSDNRTRTLAFFYKTWLALILFAGFKSYTKQQTLPRKNKQPLSFCVN